MEFRRAITEAERKAIFQLRYDIYVQEMQVYVDKADHENRVFTVAQDATDRLFYATENGATVGAISLVVGADVPMSAELSAIFDRKRFDGIVPEQTIGAAMRLVVQPAYRSTTVPFKLMAAAAEEFVNAGTELLFCNCQPHLLNMYYRLGFRSYDVEVYNDPQFGIMVSLALIMGDDDYLQSVRSPLRSILATGTYDAGLVEAAKEMMGQSSVSKVANDTTELLELTGEAPGNAVRLFDGLTEEEVKQVIALGHSIDCKQGDLVIKEGQVTKTVFVPLAGSLEVRQKGQLIAYVQTGEVMGEQAFLLDGRRTADVYAGAEGARVLSLNERNLTKLIDKSGRVAAILMLNISKSLATRLERTTRALQTS